MPSKRKQKSTSLRERMEAIHEIDQSDHQHPPTQGKARRLKAKGQKRWQPPRSKKKRVQKKWMKRMQQSQGESPLDTTGIDD